MGTYSWNLSHFLQWVISLLLMLFLFVLLSRWGIKREHGVLFCDVTHVTLMPLPKILSFGFYAVEFLAWLWNSTHPTKGCNPIQVDSLGTIATWWRAGRGMPGMSWAEGLKGQLYSELSKPWGPSMRLWSHGGVKGELKSASRVGAQVCAEHVEFQICVICRHISAHEQGIWSHAKPPSIHMQDLPLGVFLVTFLSLP